MVLGGAGSAPGCQHGAARSRSASVATELAASTVTVETHGSVGLIAPAHHLKYSLRTTCSLLLLLPDAEQSEKGTCRSHRRILPAVMYADEAWVTLATNDTYCLGALVLAHSLRKVNTTRTLHCMVTPNVSNDMRTNLSYVFDHITEVNLMDSRDAAKLAMIQRPDLGVTFTKLHCWKLEQYKKCVFVDADCLVLQKCDEIFEYPEFSAAPDIGWPDIFNSGVFVFVPSVDTFKKLVELAIKEGSFDGGDQGLLNVFFSDWLSRGPSHRLPFIYNAAASAVYTYIAALKRFGKDVKIVHFIGANKPWTLLSSDVLAQAAVSPDNPEAGFLHYWFGIFGERVLTSLNPDFLPSDAERQALLHDRSVCKCAICKWCPKIGYVAHADFFPETFCVTVSRWAYENILPTSFKEARRGLREAAKDPAFYLLLDNDPSVRGAAPPSVRWHARYSDESDSDDRPVSFDHLKALLTYRASVMHKSRQKLILKPSLEADTRPPESMCPYGAPPAQLAPEATVPKMDIDLPAPSRRFYVRRKSSPALAELDAKKLLRQHRRSVEDPDAVMALDAPMAPAPVPEAKVVESSSPPPPKMEKKQETALKGKVSRSKSAPSRRRSSDEGAAESLTVEGLFERRRKSMWSEWRSVHEKSTTNSEGKHEHWRMSSRHVHESAVAIQHADLGKVEAPPLSGPQDSPATSSVAIATTAVSKEEEEARVEQAQSEIGSLKLTTAKSETSSSSMESSSVTVSSSKEVRSGSPTRRARRTWTMGKRRRALIKAEEDEESKGTVESPTSSSESTAKESSDGSDSPSQFESLKLMTDTSSEGSAASTARRIKPRWRSGRLRSGAKIGSAKVDGDAAGVQLQTTMGRSPPEGAEPKSATVQSADKEVAKKDTETPVSSKQKATVRHVGEEAKNSKKTKNKK